MFKINNDIWTICFVEPYSYYLMKDNGSFTIGMTDYNTKTVYIACGLDFSTLCHVIIHEITHCIIFSFHIHMDIYNEELLCNVMENYAILILEITYYILNCIL